ncbi:MAG TPA: nuclease-related domain-containing protein [Gammaproteobacteria bacterium]|nr:nuclease-related domain-containing protein [Gammaproteobacteria bacterium]
MSSVPAGWLIAAAVLVGALALVAGSVALARRRRSIGYLLRRIAWEQLEDVIIPDDVDGEIHLDRALLTPRGILVLEVRHVSGTLFWGDQLEQWTVLDGARRVVLQNPLPGMRARRHAVHALAPTVPVDGRVLLVGGVTIAGETPPGVVTPEDLVAEIPARDRKPPPARLSEAWQALKKASRPV